MTTQNTTRAELLDPGLHKWGSRALITVAALVILLFPLSPLRLELEALLVKTALCQQKAIRKGAYARRPNPKDALRWAGVSSSLNGGRTSSCKHSRMYTNMYAFVKRFIARTWFRCIGGTRPLRASPP